jgi:hypothetical protein
MLQIAVHLAQSHIVVRAGAAARSSLLAAGEAVWS